jgi:AMP nucleosidase
LARSAAPRSNVLAHGYVRDDHVLDEELPLWMPIPALAEMQVALAFGSENKWRKP